jgi:hypothetical protein
VNHPAVWPYFFTTDLANIVIPTKLTALGGSAFADISKHFAGGAQEQGGYIGLPLLAIAWAYAREAPRTGLRRLLLVCLGVFVALSFGPGLWIGGHYTAIALPWALFVYLPLLGAALPARFAIFSALVLAIIATLWLAGAPAGRAGKGRYVLAILACVALLTRPHPWFAVPRADFFQPGRVQAALGPHPRLLLLPFSINGPSSAWQQESRFSFSQTGGYLGFPPAAMQHYKAVQELFGNSWGGDFPADFTAFCAGTATQFVVAGPGTPAGLLAVLARLNWQRRQIDDVTVFTVPGPAANG